MLAIIQEDWENEGQAIGFFILRKGSHFAGNIVFQCSISSFLENHSVLRTLPECNSTFNLQPSNECTLSHIEYYFRYKKLTPSARPYPSAAASNM